MEIVFASKNTGKIREVQEMLSGHCFHVTPMADAGLDMDILEDGETFEANALKKATQVMRAAGKPTLADDSGLEIDFLGKQPGVHSSRFLGEQTSYDIKNQMILDMLKDTSGSERAARFICVMALAFPNGKTIITHGVLEGVISTSPKGGGGFGYDPIFFVPELGMTLGEAAPEQKHSVSHRGMALREMAAKLGEIQ